MDGSPQVFVKGVDVRYKLLGELGRGGMGQVYLAQEVPIGGTTPVGKKVALKFLNVHELAEKVPVKDRPTYLKELLARFVQEGKLGFRFDHPNIVKVVDHGVDTEERPFLVMEYIDHARPLSVLRQEALDSYQQGLNRSEDGRILHGLRSWTELVTMGRDLAHALHAMHRENVVHRDIKPENVLATGKGRGLKVYILDLGIAKVVNRRTTGQEKLTADGRLVGTLTNMAPEQVAVVEDRNGKQWDVGPWTDVYALGTLLYEMLTGHMCHEIDDNASEWQYLIKIRSEAPTPIERWVADADPVLAEVIMRCMAKEPGDRPTALQVHELLSQHLRQPSMFPEPDIRAQEARRSDPDAVTGTAIPGPARLPSEYFKEEMETVNASKRPQGFNWKRYRTSGVGIIAGCVGLLGMVFGSYLANPEGFGGYRRRPVVVTLSSTTPPTIDLDPPSSVSSLPQVYPIPAPSATQARSAVTSVAATASASVKISPLPKADATSAEERKLAKVYSDGLALYSQQNWKMADIRFRYVLDQSGFTDVPRIVLLVGESKLRMGGQDAEAKKFFQRYLAYPGSKKEDLSPEARRFLDKSLHPLFLWKRGVFRSTVLAICFDLSADKSSKYTPPF